MQPTIQLFVGVFPLLKTQDHELEQALFVMADGVIMMVTYDTNNSMAGDPRCDNRKTPINSIYSKIVVWKC